MKHVFEALPHIDKIWVTKDGNYHLHPHYGGTIVIREDANTKIEQPKKVVLKTKLNDK